MKNLQKHFAAITTPNSTNRFRPILQTVHYNASNQTMEATDSFRLLIVKLNEELPTSFCINPKTMEPISPHGYPDLDRLVPKNSVNFLRMTGHVRIKDNLSMLLSVVNNIIKENTISLNEKTKHLHIPKGVSKKYTADKLKKEQDVIKVSFDSGSISFEGINGNAYILADINEDTYNGKGTLIINPVFLKKALEFLKDFYASNKEDTLLINFNVNHCTLVFRAENDPFVYMIQGKRQHA